MSDQIITDHDIESLKAAASWPGADRATLITLATVLAATGADSDGFAYFEALAESQPDQVLPQALAGYFQVRIGADIAAGVARLDDAASRDLGPAQYYRGLALAPLPGTAAAPDLIVQGEPHLVLALFSGQLTASQVTDRGLKIEGDASVLQRVLPEVAAAT